MIHRFLGIASLKLVCCGLLIFAALPASADNPKAYVGNFKDNTVSVIDLDRAAVVATIPVSAGPHGMTATPDGHEVYISGDGSSNVDVIDTATDRVARTIEVGKSPHGLATLPDGKTVLVCVYGEDRLAFIDTATHAVVGTVPVAKPHTIAVRPDGRFAYAASQEPGHFALIVIDLASRRVARSIALDKPPRDLEFGFDGKALYFTLAGVNAVQVLDPATDTIAAQVSTGVSPHIAGLFRGAPAGMAVVQGPGEILLFDPNTNAPLRSIAVGKQPHWIAPAAGGKIAVVTNEGSNDVTIIDLVAGDKKTVPVGNAPRKVTVPATAPATPQAAVGAAVKVSIANFAFAPKEVTIKTGASVTWVNDDGAPHGLSYKDGAPGQDLMLPGAAFTRKYDVPGTFDYVCAVHPFMQGRVTVRNP